MSTKSAEVGDILYYVEHWRTIYYGVGSCWANQFISFDLRSGTRCRTLLISGKAKSGAILTRFTEWRILDADLEQTRNAPNWSRTTKIRRASHSLQGNISLPQIFHFHWHWLETRYDPESSSLVRTDQAKISFLDAHPRHSVRSDQMILNRSARVLNCGIFISGVKGP